MPRLQQRLISGGPKMKHRDTEMGVWAALCPLGSRNRATWPVAPFPIESGWRTR